MRKLKIVFLDSATIGEDVSLQPISSLGELTTYPSTAPDDVVERIKGYDVVITNKVWVGKKEMESNPALKLICVAATGMNNVDLVHAASKGIPVRNAVNYSTESVAQVTFMHILNLVGKASYFDNVVKSGHYSAAGSFTDVTNPFYELKGKRLGIIGLGNIGSRVAQIAEVFGMTVSYFPTSGKAHSDRYPAKELGQLLAESDVISIHAPLNERTKDLITRKELKSMNPKGYIVNMGRGGIIKEADLAAALDEGIIAGAAVDVFTKEPLPADHPYLTMQKRDKLLLTPHIGWASKEAREVLVAMIADNIKYI
ncbi:MAG: D-2-hydroxyacid dehydrogenase [Bacteroidales bacterium]|jgi:lactate dehydrogenase-like 2-hydroxyacid dehydrogenase|nr:D-2-hydroxyacid dehydrogenase [Bacteroidales bacterium]